MLLASRQSGSTRVNASPCSSVRYTTRDPPHQMHTGTGTAGRSPWCRLLATLVHAISMQVQCVSMVRATHEQPTCKPSMRWQAHCTGKQRCITHVSTVPRGTLWELHQQHDATPKDADEAEVGAGHACSWTHHVFNAPQCSMPAIAMP
jgi:hypothetical protein